MRCFWVLRQIGGAVRRHQPHKWIGRAHHAGHAGGAKAVKILVCVAGGIGGLGIGGASQWGSGSTAGAALPPPAAVYSDIPGLESGWFGLPGSALVSGPGVFSDTPNIREAESIMAANQFLAAPPETLAMGESPPVAHGAVPERLLGTIESTVPVSEPLSTVKLMLVAMLALAFLALTTRRGR